jgi:3-mercaptopyruvate sulfurtransferase SseA
VRGSSALDARRGFITRRPPQTGDCHARPSSSHAAGCFRLRWSPPPGWPNTRHPGLKVVDASTYLASAGRNARAEYDAQHIPGAVFADIDWLSDETSALPHTIPSAEKFAERIGSLGISSDDAVVVYDGSGQNFSAPRLWFMLRAFGHARVAVLDGGLRRWMLDGHSVTADVTPLAPAPFTASGTDAAPPGGGATA